MDIQGTVFRHSGQTTADQVLRINELTVCERIETRKCELAASFVHLLGDAAAQLVQFAI
jgi:hypothetical protein